MPREPIVVATPRTWGLTLLGATMTALTAFAGACNLYVNGLDDPEFRPLLTFVAIFGGFTWFGWWFEGPKRYVFDPAAGELRPEGSARHFHAHGRITLEDVERIAVSWERVAKHDGWRIVVHLRPDRPDPQGLGLPPVLAFGDWGRWSPDAAIAELERLERGLRGLPIAFERPQSR